MVRDIDPMGIFLVKTKVAEAIVASVIRSIGFSFFILVPSIRRSGGLAFCWCPDLNFDVILKS